MEYAIIGVVRLPPNAGLYPLLKLVLASEALSLNNSYFELHPEEELGNTQTPHAFHMEQSND